MQKLNFSQIHPNKLSISFTWDDNFFRHIEIIAPKFKEYNYRCTFYVNPGEPDFPARLSKGYAKLSAENFEIGSHGHTHHHFTKLTKEKYFDQLIQSKKAIEQSIGKAPCTFAFPHHDYTDKMLKDAQSVYLETRNTLNNTQRVSLKSNTSINDIEKAIEDSIKNEYSIVFSGHSVSLPNDYDQLDGYEPIKISFLDEVLKKLSIYSIHVEVLTFEQAAIKGYIVNNCSFDNKCFELTTEQELYLREYDITFGHIQELI